MTASSLLQQSLFRYTFLIPVSSFCPHISSLFFSLYRQMLR